ncbi:conserved hypothetical protein [Agrobacterium deltaense NCPPB 1641]|uniref:Uncharacterized protein n=1 Tax=Agrobacterium deltaense NCPPB 1641 TaxID=1183425 RepID=A0A1S7TS10_9HYPH|nr:conserved hypothetical protein [Agrobacterium deltaense NCPPB 1641]
MSPSRRRSMPRPDALFPGHAPIQYVGPAVSDTGETNSQWLAGSLLHTNPLAGSCAWTPDAQAIHTTIAAFSGFECCNAMSCLHSSPMHVRFFERF